MKFSKMEMPKGKKKAEPKGDSGMDLFAFEGEEMPEGEEAPEGEEGMPLAGEETAEEEAAELSALSDDEILAEAKKRGLV